MNFKILLLFVAVVLFFHGCAAIISNNEVISNELVMSEGMSITAENRYGSLTITAGKGFERFYTWAGDTRSVVMWPRKKRWNGSLGIYYPGPGNHWKEHDGITRLVAEEGQLHFDSLTDLTSFINRYEDDGSFVYSDDGLFVSWIKMPAAGGTLHVQVWQFFVNGIKPKKIPGSRNDKILVIIK